MGEVACLREAESSGEAKAEVKSLRTESPGHYKAFERANGWMLE